MGTQRATAKPATPQRSPERAALATAIAERDKQRLRVREAVDACSNVDVLVQDAQRRLTRASAAAKAAREQHSQRIADAARTNTPLPSGTASRTAIQHELECADELEAIKRAATVAQQTLDDVKHSLDEAELKIASAADQVLRAEDGKALVAEMEEVQHRLMMLRLQHRYFRKNRLYPDKETEKRGERLCSWEFAPASGAIEYQQFDRHPRYLDWQLARDALMKDANAPLPGQPGHQPLPLPPDPAIKLAQDRASTDAAIASLHAQRAAEASKEAAA